MGIQIFTTLGMCNGKYIPPLQQVAARTLKLISKGELVPQLNHCWSHGYTDLSLVVSWHRYFVKYKLYTELQRDWVHHSQALSLGEADTVSLPHDLIQLYVHSCFILQYAFLWTMDKWQNMI